MIAGESIILELEKAEGRIDRVCSTWGALNWSKPRGGDTGRRRSIWDRKRELAMQVRPPTIDCGNLRVRRFIVKGGTR